MFHLQNLPLFSRPNDIEYLNDFWELENAVETWRQRDSHMCGQGFKNCF